MINYNNPENPFAIKVDETGPSPFPQANNNPLSCYASSEKAATSFRVPMVDNKPQGVNPSAAYVVLGIPGSHLGSQADNKIPEVCLFPHVKDNYDTIDFFRYSNVSEASMERAKYILNSYSNNNERLDYMRYDDFNHDAHYFQEIESYRNVNKDDVILNVLADFAEASTTLCFAGYRIEEFFVITREYGEELLINGLSPLQLYVMSGYSKEQRKKLAQYMSPLYDEGSPCLKAENYHMAHGLEPIIEQITKERHVNTDDYLLETFCKRSEAAFKLADFGLNYSKYIYLSMKSIGYLVDEALDYFYYARRLHKNEQEQIWYRDKIWNEVGKSTLDTIL